MANGSLGGATPLGYGAAILPQSSFDPVRAGQQLNLQELEDARIAEAAQRERGKEERERQEKRRIEKKQDFQKFLEDLNPEFGKIKWTGAYMKEIEPQLKEHQSKMIGYYRDQGYLTQEQELENRAKQLELTTKNKMFNTEYQKFLDAKKLVVENPMYKTDENRKVIDKWTDIYQNEKGAINKAGGILEWLHENPIETQIKPKEEPFNPSERADTYVTDALKYTKGDKLEYDPNTNQYIQKEKKGINLTAIKESAAADWDADPYVLQKRYPNREDWEQFAVNRFSAVHETAKFKNVPQLTEAERKRQLATARLRIGGFDVTGGQVKLVEDDRDINTVLKTVGDEKTKDAKLGEEADDVSQDQKTMLEYNIGFDGVLMQTAEGKDVDLNSFVNEAYMLTDKGMVAVPIGDTVNMKANSIRNMAVAQEDMNLSRLITPAYLDILKKNNIVGKDNILKKGKVISLKAQREMEEQGATGKFKQAKYVVTRIKDFQNVIDKDELPTYKQAILKATFVPYDQVRAALELKGVKEAQTGSQTETPKGAKKQRRVTERLNPNTGEYQVRNLQGGWETLTKKQYDEYKKNKKAGGGKY